MKNGNGRYNDYQIRKALIVLEVAKKLFMENRTMWAGDLAKVLNEANIKSVTGGLYSVSATGRNMFRVVSVVYDLVLDMFGQEEADKVSSSFTRMDGVTYAYQ